MRIGIQFELEIDSADIHDIYAAFSQSLRPAIQGLISSVVSTAGDAGMADGSIADKLGGPVAWKTKTGTRTTALYTPWGWVRVPLLQVTTKDDKRRHYITRMLLGIERWTRIPDATRRTFAGMALHATYRACQAIGAMLGGAKHALGTLQRAAVKIGTELMPSIDHSEKAVYEADGTGIPITGGGKKYEIKVLSQRTRDGKIRIAGMVMGKVQRGWGSLIRMIQQDRRQAVIIQDGDRGIRRAIASLGRGISVQICLWHIAHALKHALWADGEKGKSRTKGYVFGRLHKILRERHDQMPETVEHRLKCLSGYCRRRGLANTAAYLDMAAPLSQTYRYKGSGSATTSKTERVMRTLNKRINVGTWSMRGAEAICRLRGAWYYNGWRP